MMHHRNLAAGEGVQIDIEDYELECALEDLTREVRDLREARILLKILPILREMMRR